MRPKLARGLWSQRSSLSVVVCMSSFAPLPTPRLAPHIPTHKTLASQGRGEGSRSEETTTEKTTYNPSQTPAPQGRPRFLRFALAHRWENVCESGRGWWSKVVVRSRRQSFSASMSSFPPHSALSPSPPRAPEGWEPGPQARGKGRAEVGRRWRHLFFSHFLLPKTHCPFLRIVLGFWEEERKKRAAAHPPLALRGAHWAREGRRNGRAVSFS